jgi:hypothetical protein
VRLGHETSKRYLSCSGQTSSDSTKKHAWTRYAELVFSCPVGFVGSHIAFRCIQATKRRCTIFHTWVGPVWFVEKARRDTLHRTCVFASAGHVVHCSASGVRNIDALFLCSGGTGTDSTKSALAHIMSNLHFRI